MRPKLSLTLLVVLLGGLLCFYSARPGARHAPDRPRSAPGTPAATLPGLGAVPSQPGTPASANEPAPAPSLKTTSSAPGPGRVPDIELLPAHTLAQIDALEAEKSRRTPVQNKMDSQLLFALRKDRGQPIVTGIRELSIDLDVDDAQRVLVDITATVSEPLLALIRGQGGRVVNAFAEYSAIRAWLPLSGTEQLAARSDVSFVQPAVRATVNAGSVSSEGDVAHRAGVARNTYGVTGAGVKVGVLSDSVDFLDESRASGDLPNVTVLTGQSGVPASGEGTAMLEIVHDIAPGATLYYATAFNGPASFANNIRQLRAAGCDIIIDDVYYFNESPFQDGVIAQAVNDVTADGALFFSSAGNSGNKNDSQSGVWEGDFVESGQTTSQGGKIHTFGSAAFNTATPGGSSARVDLFWADPLGAAGNDYDVYVMDSNGNVVSSSNNTQNGSQDPREALNKLEVGQRLVVVKYSGAARYLHLATGRGRLSTSTGGQTKGHNCAEAAFCVAAVSARNATLPFTASYKVETFSSDGPRRLFFHPNGQAMSPGNFTSTGGVVRQKPDIAAADGVLTTIPGDSGLNPFYGTSAAAPHAGALAALVKSLNPALTPAEMRTLLTTKTLDIEATGVDRDAGYGLLMADLLLEAVQSSGQPSISNFSPTNGVAGTEVTINGAKFTGVQSVKFNGLDSDFTVNSSTRITAIVPAGATTGPIAVTTAGGTATGSRPFTILIVPGITSLTPSSGSAGTVVTITGANLVGATSVNFGTRAAQSFTVVSPQEITAVVPVGAQTAKVTVTTPNGSASSPGNFVVNTLPVISDFTPLAGPAGAQVTISGANFINVSAVSFNGVASTSVSVQSNSRLTAIVPAGASAGPIRVTTPAGTAVSSSAFVVAQTPTVAGIIPNSGPPGTVVTINGTALGSPSAVTFNGVAAEAFSGASTTQVIATVPAGASTGPVRVTTPGGAASGPVFTVLTGPANNDFANAQQVAGGSGSITGTTMGATREQDEPLHAGNGGGRSIWYRWTAPASGAYRFDTIGSGFDTLLAVYTGSNLGQLTLVTANDDIVTGVTTNSTVTFIATAGATYRVAIDGWSAPDQSREPSAGPVTLNWAAATVSPAIGGFAPTSGAPGTSVVISGANFAGATKVEFGAVPAEFMIDSATQITATVPAGAGSAAISVSTPAGRVSSTAQFTTTAAINNNLFANALMLTPAAGRTNSSNVNATKETGEPNHAGAVGGRSVWFRWTAPASGVWSFETAGSDFDTLLAVYTGSGVATLAPVAANDDSGGLFTSSASFSAFQGTTYFIAVDGYGAESGNISLRWSAAPALPSISTLTPGSGLPGQTVTIQGANLGGTIGVKFGILSAPYNVVSATQVTASVPPNAETATVTVLTTNGTASSPNMFVVTGPRPANDNFADRIVLTGDTTTVPGLNAGATLEANEPEHPYASGGSSVWWRWTAPRSGDFTVTTRGSSFDTLLAVYRGNNLTSLIEVGASDDAPNLDTQSRVTFPATSGTTYQIMVDGYAGDAGTIVLSVYPTTAPDLLFYSGFEESEGYFVTETLAGQQDWQSLGIGANGIVFNEFDDFGQQGYIGFFSAAPGETSYVWPTIEHTPNLPTRPVVVFSTFMKIVDSSNGRYDLFSWEAYNRDGDFLFGLDFDNFTMDVSYVPDDQQPVASGMSFRNEEVMYLEVSMDFAANTWSASLDGAEIVRNIPISTTGAALNLGDIDAVWYRTSGTYGDNYMAFDDYLVTAEPNHAPRIITQPQSVAITAGGDAQFRVVVDSYPSVEYQWRFNGQNIPGATGPGLLLSRVTAADAGAYSVVVSNYAGVVTSAAANLAVVQPPNLVPERPPGTMEPLAVFATPGQPAPATFRPDQDLLVSWAVTNRGAPVTNRFFAQLYVDGALRQSWGIDSLGAGAVQAYTNFSIGKLSAGSHVLRLEIDAAAAVAESDETDNSYTKEVIVAAGQQLPIVLSGPMRLENGGFQFILNGASGGRYDILSSSNLLQWILIGDSLTADAAGALTFTDTSATNVPIRFYRARNKN